MEHGSFTAQMLEIASMSPHHEIERRNSTNNHQHSHQYHPINHQNHHHRNNMAGRDFMSDISESSAGMKGRSSRKIIMAYQMHWQDQFFDFS